MLVNKTMQSDRKKSSIFNKSQSFHRPIQLRTVRYNAALQQRRVWILKIVNFYWAIFSWQRQKFTLRAKSQCMTSFWPRFVKSHRMNCVSSHVFVFTCCFGWTGGCVSSVPNFCAGGVAWLCFSRKIAHRNTFRFVSTEFHQKWTKKKFCLQWLRVNPI